MARTKLFSDFEGVSVKQWKQQIQFDLKGADYNETLVWESPEGIKVKPFYTTEDLPLIDTKNSNSAFKILQDIFVFDVAKSNLRAQETIARGAESIRFTIENESISIDDLMQNLPIKTHQFSINTKFLSPDFNQKVYEFNKINKAEIRVLIDPIHQLAQDGNWFTNLETDFEKLNQIASLSDTSFLKINASLYQNAGANMVQQLAYTMAHCNEYFHRISSINHPLILEIAVGTNYFFEISKIRATRLLFRTLAAEYNHNMDCQISVVPTKRNKTLYDYNTNMLRTTTECMSAVLGSADYISNLAYDAIYHKDNEFSDRIARNQLLILKNESYFDKVSNPADGAYYIESLTNQLAEKALVLFKEIEKNDGFITQLMDGNIQKKIAESAKKEQELFDAGKEILLGTNKYPNKNDLMKHDLELYPFVKHNPRKTNIVPIIEKRLAEKMEQERLKMEI